MDETAAAAQPDQERGDQPAAPDSGGRVSAEDVYAILDRVMRGEDAS